MSQEPKNKLNPPLAAKINWQPSASIAHLKARAELLHRIRAFFYDRKIVEVTTPILNPYTVTDVYLDSLTLQYNHNQIGYLHTSPEYAMKRLLAAGLGDCYQICQTFRDHEQGKQHQTEFTLLEWYRLNFNHHDLMAEMDVFLQDILHTQPAIKLSYQQAYQQYLAINPHTITLTELVQLAKSTKLFDGLFNQDELVTNTNNNYNYNKYNYKKDDWLMLFFSHCIEPHLGQNNQPVFIYDYPSSQAALAKVTTKITADGEQYQIAERFEVYLHGIELANGFHELQDPWEQQHRFQQDQQDRISLNKTVPAIDQYFIAALDHGLPACAGVALGIDRLVGIALKTETIAEVMAFGN